MDFPLGNIQSVTGHWEFQFMRLYDVGVFTFLDILTLFTFIDYIYLFENDLEFKFPAQEIVKSDCEVWSVSNHF